MDSTKEYQDIAASSPRYARLIEHLHRLGPRAIGELLRSIAEEPSDLISELERYGRLDPSVIRAIGADRFPPTPLRLVPQFKGNSE